MSDDDDMPPELDDLSEVIEKARPKEQASGTGFSGDYTKTREEIQEEVSKQLAVEMEEKLKLKAEKERKQAEEDAKKPKAVKQDGLFSGGLSKGFFNNQAPKKATTEKPIEVKVDKEAAKRNRLEIPEVQETMRLNDQFANSKDQWMNPALIGQMATNPKVQKLFTNPEYMKAIGQMQTNPKETMERYKNNQEFMDIFQEFCKIMGTHFQDLSEKEKVAKQEVEAKLAAEKPLIQKVEKLDPEQKRLNDLIQNDPQVREALQDPKVQKFIQFLQTQKKVDFHSILQNDRDLAAKLQILIQKKVLNLQGF